MQRRNFLRLAAFGTVASLAGCQTAPPPARFAQLTFGHLGPIRLNAARIEIVDEYPEPLRPPNVEHLFPTPPKQALRRWASDRLVAAGGEGHYARFVIQEAKAVATDLKTTPGLRGYFTTDQSERYDLSLAAALEIRQERGDYRDGFATATASRTRTVAEDASVAQRERVWFDMLEQAMQDFNAEFERQIRANLPRFLAL